MSYIESFVIMNALVFTLLLLFNLITVPVYSLIQWTISIIDDEKDNYILIGKNPCIKNIGDGFFDGA
jgi:hypothetical protein